MRYIYDHTGILFESDLPPMHNGKIRVITGIRRCGKSVLLFALFRDHLIEQSIAEEQIMIIELDQRKSCEFRNPITLCEYIEACISPNKSNQFYLFIDEAQFTKTVKGEENDDTEISIYDNLIDFLLEWRL